jgi:putative addiction module component (TIGR02574 family)
MRMAQAQAQDILEAAMRLEPGERARLAHELIASLDGPADEDAEQLWREEVARRVGELDAGRATLRSWHDVHERAARALRGL